MATKSRKKSSVASKAQAPRKVMGYTVARVQTTDPVQLQAMREPDIETGGGANIRHVVRAGR